MKLSIGAISKIFGVSKDTLRYYDKIGILKPEVNEENKYRYYDFRNIEQLGLILGIKCLGISLGEIKEVMECGNINEYKNALSKQEEIVERKISELQLLQKRLKEVGNIINEIIDFNNEEDFEKLQIEELDTCIYGVDAKKLLLYDTGSEKNEIDKEGFIYVYNILDNSEVIEDESIMYLSDHPTNKKIIKDYNGKGKVIKGKFVVTYFYGSINEMNDYILRLNRYFKGHPNNEVYLNYRFYIPQKNDDEYFVKIKLKINSWH